MNLALKNIQVFIRENCLLEVCIFILNLIPTNSKRILNHSILIQNNPSNLVRIS
jgi:hypothetical protein